MKRARPLRAAEPEVAVELRGLTKRFGALVAVDRVDLDIPVGSFFGMVGPNGAGKTTTLKMVTALLRPDAGRVTIHGIDVWADSVEAKRIIGVLPDDPRFFERLTGAELLTYNGLLRQMNREVVEPRVAELLEVMGLADAAHQAVVEYSQGMRKKIGIACALLHNPTVVFLDEPFESVDPVSARGIRDVLVRFTESGGTVIFSSHVMDTVQRLCDRVAIMHAGRIVAAGRTADVRQGRQLEDVFIERVGTTFDAAEHLTWLRPSSG